MIRAWVGWGYLSFWFSPLPGPRIAFMTVLLESFSLVAIAEIGDKTQLLAILLAARFRRCWAIVLGILIATLVNHALVAWMGKSIGGWLDPFWLNISTSVLFIVIGVWTLVPDTAPLEQKATARGAFLASVVAFFFAEMGDKTQLATLTLGAQYPQTYLVILGTTLGMLAANVPAVLCGEALLRKLPMRYIRMFACLMFLAFGFYGLILAV